MRRWRYFTAGMFALALFVAGAGFAYLRTAQGMTTRARPGSLEAFAAREARALALPDGAREVRNPVADSAEVQAEARAHWADHCAGCHSNNGSGEAEMGKHMYPPAPDMRQANTQNLTDGELFYVIRNGIRLTGMPSWGSGTKRDEQDSWKLVRFIRHLPNLTAAEQKEMEAANPKTPDELKEEQEEEDFLNGDKTNETTEHRHHH